MRKMQDFVIKGKEIFIGLEDSKRTWKLCVRCDRMIVHELSMPAEYPNLRGYLERGYPECKTELIYEAGFGGFWLHDLLEDNGVTCIVTPASKVTVEKVNKVKTDKRDARRLAKVLENRDYTSCWVPDRELREDRQISRTLDQIQRHIVATKNRIRKFLDFHGLNEDLRPGAWNPSDYQLLRNLELGGSLQLSLDVFLEELDKLVQLRRRLMKELMRLSKKDRYCQSVKLKQSSPGIGWLSAIRFTLEWGDLSRFKSGKHLGSYIGFTSSEYSTGDTVRRGRITGQGRGQVRAWLIQCAWRAIRIDPVLLTKFRAVWAHSGSKKKAIVAVARKMAARIWTIEMRNEPYQIGVIR
jgi:transposase